MIVSVRRPAASPVPSRLRCSLLRFSRLSEPTSRYVVPGCLSGRSPLGNASTLSILVHAHTGTAIRKTSHTSSTIRTIRHGDRFFFSRGFFSGARGGRGGGAAVVVDVRRGPPGPSPEVSGRGITGIIRVGSGSSDCGGGGAPAPPCPRAP
jgi:hypothetical protein